MAIDPAAYEGKRRAIGSQYNQQTAANELGRFVGQQRSQRDLSDYQMNFKRSIPQYTAGYNRRNLAGSGVQSGVYQKAMSNYLGDYARNYGRLQTDYDMGQQQYAENDAQFAAERDAALAQLEYDKANEIANTAAQLSALRPYYGG